MEICQKEGAYYYFFKEGQFKKQRYYYFYFYLVIIRYPNIRQHGQEESFFAGKDKSINWKIDPCIKKSIKWSNLNIYNNLKISHIFWSQVSIVWSAYYLVLILTFVLNYSKFQIGSVYWRSNRATKIFKFSVQFCKTTRNDWLKKRRWYFFSLKAKSLFV